MKRQRAGLAAVLCLILSSGPALAQAPKEAPKPGPEHKRLGYFVGKWTTEGEVKPNGFMPAGKFTGTDNCEWFDGGFAVVCHTDGKGAMGTMKSLGILGYSTEEKFYTYHGVNNGPRAMTTVSRGSLTGGTWTYEDQSKMGGKMVKSRYVIKETSPTSYTFQMDMQGEGGAWATIMEGKATKAP